MSPLSPFGIVKLKVVVVPDVEAETEAFVPGESVVVVPTEIVGVVPTVPFVRFVPFCPGGIVKAKFTPFVVLDIATPAVVPELTDAETLVVFRMSVVVGMSGASATAVPPTVSEPGTLTSPFDLKFITSASLQLSWARTKSF